MGGGGVGGKQAAIAPAGQEQEQEQPIVQMTQTPGSMFGKYESHAMWADLNNLPKHWPGVEPPTFVTHVENRQNVCLKQNIYLNNITTIIFTLLLDECCFHCSKAFRGEIPL